MTQPVYTCGIRDMANVPAQIMWERDCGVVPVIDDDGRLAGIVTDRDICMGAHLQGVPLSLVPVASVMAPDVVACGADDEVGDVQRLMTERQVRRVPVLDADGAPVGIVSMSDLAIGLQRAGRLKQKTAQQLADTLVAVCTPRDDAFPRADEIDDQAELTTR